MQPRTRLTAAFVVVATAVSCSSQQPGDSTAEPQPNSVELSTTDCDGLRTVIATSVTEAVLHARYGGIQIDDKLGGKGDAVDTTDDEDVELESEPPRIEVEDLVKVVNGRLFVLAGDRLDIVTLGDDGTLKAAGYFGVGDGLASVGMFADNSFAVLLHELSDDADGDLVGTRVTIVDVSDTMAPKLHRQFDVEGEFEMARRQGTQVELVTSSRWRVERDVWELAYGEAPGLPEPEPNAGEARQAELRAAARDTVTARVDELLGDTDDLMPRLAEQDDEPTGLVECDTVHAATPASSVRVTTLTRFEPEGELTTFGIVGDDFAGDVNGDHFFAAFSDRWGPFTGTSRLHVFDRGDGYVASTALPGTLVDQYSIAATDSTVNVITVDEGAALHEVSVDGGELTVGDPATVTDAKLVVANRITSTAAYVATGGDEDQIVALPLGASEPNGPFEIGGVPSMIHPLDGEQILVVAQQNNDDGNQVGVRVQVFESDADPVASADIDTGEFAAWSEAMWEPRSLAYSGDGLVAFPVNIEEWSDAEGSNFSGVLVYDTSGGVERRAAIDHSDLRARNWCVANDQPEDCAAPASNPWWTHVRRSAFVGDFLITVSEAGVKAHDTSSFEELSALTFD